MNFFYVSAFFTVFLSSHTISVYLSIGFLSCLTFVEQGSARLPCTITSILEATGINIESDSSIHLETLISLLSVEETSKV